MIAHQATVAVATEQLDRFKDRALGSPDPELRVWYIRAAEALIFDLVSVGAISNERGDEMVQAWVHRYAAALPNAPTITEGSDARH